MIASEMLAPSIPGIVATAIAAFLIVFVAAIALRPRTRHTCSERLHLAYKKTALYIAGARAWPSDNTAVALKARPLPEYETVC